ncbi:response regulator transcription factor [Bacillus sp. FJAT-45350]|uniref:response regulator transcription factor n=1 Tax=Bacillus sp. FJAT-45350 TaxID=2011014 RepID=UPI000BB85E7E|nr:response regulator transcription factor [Bacillus sp. FJAT-45350]
MYKVFIVEDDFLMRYSLEVMLNNEDDMKVIGKAENGEEAIKKISNEQPDIVLMDIRLPIMDGITCTKLIKEKFPNIVVLILTTFNEDEYIYEGLAYKANGYILKNINNDKLIKTIREAAKGQFIMPEEVAAKLSNRLHKLYDHASLSMKLNKIFDYLEQDNIQLSKKEREIVELVLEKLNNREVAKRLFISEGTVKNYLTVLYTKLGVKNRNQLIDYFRKLDKKQLN